MVAAPLPIRVILSILGVPVSDSDYLVELSNYLIEGTGDRPTLPADAYGNTTPLRLLPFGSAASHALYEYGEQIGEARRAAPQDDIVTQLVLAEDDGERLSRSEYRNLFHVLVFAGNETTRTALTHGAMAFADHPQQWARLAADRTLLDPAVEEVLRWSTPVLHMRRTAVGDTELAGTSIAAGDKVVMWYASANYDPIAFADPMRFDISARETVHTTFGGGGPHFCLGAFLARMEIAVVLDEMMRRGIRLTPSGPPQRVASNFVHGIASVSFGVERIAEP
jgi:cholest-4-en-3-one 26-monooxygenase